MDDLIRFDENNQTISARELHEKLNIATRFNDWFPRMCAYGFTEGIDFYTKMSKTTEVGGRPATDYDITLDMAKQICMIQRTPEGKKVREYLIRIENAWNSPEQVMARALIVANNTVHGLNRTIAALEAKIENDEPKVLFAESVETTKGGILLRDFAKFLRQNGIDIGEKRLFMWMRDNEYLLRYGTSYNTPSQKSMDLGLFEMKECVVDTNGVTRIKTTPVLTGKGQTYFMNKFLSAKEENLSK
jgi:anti-repressor protein